MKRIFTVAHNGKQLANKSFLLKFHQTVVQPDYSISSTSNGGLLLLATISNDAQSTDSDYYCIKIDAFGKQQWAKQQDGKFLDVGSKVLQASNDGYIVLGTMTLTNVKAYY